MVLGSVPDSRMSSFEFLTKNRISLPESLEVHLLRPKTSPCPMDKLCKAAESRTQLLQLSLEIAGSLALPPPKVYANCRAIALLSAIVQILVLACTMSSTLLASSMQTSSQHTPRFLPSKRKYYTTSYRIRIME